MSNSTCTVNNQSLSVSGKTGIDVTGGSQITIKLASTSNVSNWSIFASQADDVTQANGGLVAVNNSKNQNSFTATFNVPNVIAGRGVALQFTSITNQASSTQDTSTFGVFVLNSNGKRLFFGSELNESNATVGNAADLNALTLSVTDGYFFAGGDLSGTSVSQNVIALHTATTRVAVGSAAAPSAGQVLTAINSTSANWQTPAGGGAPSGAAGGDLSGTYPNPTVSTSSAIKSATTNVSTIGAAAPSTGQVLTATSSTAATWQTPSTGGGAPSGAAGGDLGGTYPNPTVTRAAGIKSATTTVATSGATAPASGQVLTATSSTTATWQTPVTALAGVTSDGYIVTMTTSDNIENISSKSQVWTAKRDFQLVGAGSATDVFNFTLSDIAVTSIDVKSVAVSNVSGGAGMFVREATFRRDGTTVLAIGATSSPVSRINNIAGADVTITNTGTTAYVRVTTPSSNTIRWFTTIVITRTIY